MGHYILFKANLRYKAYPRGPHIMAARRSMSLPLLETDCNITVMAKMLRNVSPKGLSLQVATNRPKQ